MTTEFQEAIDPQWLVTVDDLPLLARNVVHGFLSGLHKSPWLGHGSEFASYRQYIQGDDPRRIDWKLWGRTDRLFVKEFLDETNLQIHLVLDATASMDFGDPSKIRYARAAAASLAYLCLRQNDAVGLTRLGQTAEVLLPPSSANRQMEELLLELARSEVGGSATLDDAEHALGPLLERRGMLVLFSDLLIPLDLYAEFLRNVSARDQETIVFLILSPEETELSLHEPVLMQDAETGRTVRVDPDLIRDKYQAALVKHRAELRRISEDFEADLVECRTDEPLDQMLIAYLDRRWGML